MLDVEVAQGFGERPIEVFRRDESQVVVVARLQTVVPVAAVAQELEALGSTGPTGLLLLVAALQDGQEVVGAPIAKLVVQIVRDGKVREPAGAHEPAEVGGGDRLLVEKRHGVQRAGGLSAQVVVHLVPAPGRGEGVRPTVVTGYLCEGAMGQVLAFRSVILHAKSEPATGGIARRRSRLPSAGEGDETRQRTVGDALEQLGLGEGRLLRWKPDLLGVVSALGRRQTLPDRSVKRLRPPPPPLPQHVVVGVFAPPVTVAVTVTERTRESGPRPSAVNVRAAGRCDVHEFHAVGGNGSQPFGQTPAEFVHSLRQPLGLEHRGARGGGGSAAAGTAGLVAVVVPRLAVMIDVGQNGVRLVPLDVGLEGECQIAPLVRPPTEDLLAGARVNGRSDATGLGDATGHGLIDLG